MCAWSTSERLPPRRSVGSTTIGDECGSPRWRALEDVGDHWRVSTEPRIFWIRLWQCGRARGEPSSARAEERRHRDKGPLAPSEPLTRSVHSCRSAFLVASDQGAAFGNPPSDSASPAAVTRARSRSAVWLARRPVKAEAAGSNLVGTASRPLAPGLVAVRGRAGPVLVRLRAKLMAWRTNGVHSQPTSSRGPVRPGRDGLFRALALLEFLADIGGRSTTCWESRNCRCSRRFRCGRIGRGLRSKRPRRAGAGRGSSGASGAPRALSIRARRSRCTSLDLEMFETLGLAVGFFGEDVIVQFVRVLAAAAERVADAAVSAFVVNVGPVKLQADPSGLELAGRMPRRRPCWTPLCKRSTC